VLYLLYQPCCQGDGGEALNHDDHPTAHEAVMDTPGREGWDQAKKKKNSPVFLYFLPNEKDEKSSPSIKPAAEIFKKPRWKEAGGTHMMSS